MPTSEEIEKEWSSQQGVRRSYYMSNNTLDGGIYALEIYEDWQKHLTFQKFVESESSLTREQEQELLTDEGTSMPHISTVRLNRYRHPQGYHIFRKDCSVTREEYMLSHFAAACNFPYAPVLPSSRAHELYTPKLGRNLTSLYGFLLNQLKKGSAEIPSTLRVSFERAVKKHGSPDKIPFRDLLKIGAFGRTGSKEFEAYAEWAQPLFERDRIFLNKMIPLIVFIGANEGYMNPTNIIVNAQTGRFIYAIDQSPGAGRFALNQAMRDTHMQDIGMNDLIDLDIVTDMQTIMQDSITDRLIDGLLSKVRALSYAVGYEGIEESNVFYFEDRLKRYGDELKRRRDNPARILDPKTMKPI